MESRNHGGPISGPAETLPISRQYGTEGLEWALHYAERPKSLGRADVNISSLAWHRLFRGSSDICVVIFWNDYVPEIDFILCFVCEVVNPRLYVESNIKNKMSICRRCFSWIIELTMA